MKVSVIIPVYNAEDYVEDAVASALAQPETAEVILAEDGSQDESLSVCRRLARVHPRVRLYRHPDGGNHGPAATRNLALNQSTCEYVAPLDADDFFVPGRFTVAGELLEADPELDGVYEALGVHFESEEAAQLWDDIGLLEARGKLTTMTKRVRPEDLFEVLVEGKHGYFSLDCLVVKRIALNKAGGFDETVYPDGDLATIWRLAAVARLAPGQLKDPVALRRVHVRNTALFSVSNGRPTLRSRPQARSREQRYETWMQTFTSVWRWCRRNNVARNKRDVLLERFFDYVVYTRFHKTGFWWSARVQKKLSLGLLLIHYPSLILELFFWQRFLPQRVYEYWKRLRNSLSEQDDTDNGDICESVS
jgi:glycosyltransferase involved in cell wall biosynthesis